MAHLVPLLSFHHDQETTAVQLPCYAPQVAYFVNSGSEANDLALRIAHCAAPGAGFFFEQLLVMVKIARPIGLQLVCSVVLIVWCWGGTPMLEPAGQLWCPLSCAVL